MARKITDENLGKLPDEPGVYFFLDKNDEVLYVGKATSLRSRVRSYFREDIALSRGPLIVSLMEKAKKIDYKETESVLEAIILEANLIKKYKPHHNTREKSDKSFNYVVITKEAFPRVLVYRERELLMEKIAPRDIKYSFGPFPNGGTLREALRLVRKIFPFRDRCDPEDGKPCFNAQIGLCPGVCAGWVSKEQYARTINHLRLFFSGRKKKLITQLRQEMKTSAKEENFEEADTLKKKIFALQHIQDVSLMKRYDEEFQDDGFRIEGYDIAHISGTSSVGVMVVLENGEAKKSDYRKFRIKTVKGADDTKSLKEILSRRIGHLEWPLPQLFVIDGGKAQHHAAKSLLRDAGIETPVVSVVKDERHRPREVLGDPKWRAKYHDQILLANSESHRFAVKYHQQVRDKIKRKR